MLLPLERLLLWVDMPFVRPVPTGIRKLMRLSSASALLVLQCLLYSYTSSTKFVRAVSTSGVSATARRTHSAIWTNVSSDIAECASKRMRNN